MNNLISSILLGIMWALIMGLIFNYNMIGMSLDNRLFFEKVAITFVVITFLVASRYHYLNFQKKMKKSKHDHSIAPTSENPFHQIAFSTVCGHCNGKAICNCELCRKQDSSLYKVCSYTWSRAKELGINRYGSFEDYYKCSVCGGMGAFPATYKVDINDDINIESMNDLQHTIISKLDKELEIIQTKDLLQKEQHKRRTNILEKEFSLAELNLEIQKERKFTTIEFLEQLKNKIFSRST